MAEDLRPLEQWLGRIIAGIEPSRRRAAALKLAQALRRANVQRIAANIEPDGGAMEKRKARDGKRLRRKMFPKLRRLREWKISADADGLEIMPVNPLVGQTAATHHFGEVGYVGRLRDGRVIRAKYPERRLLGFAEDDRALVVETAKSLLDGPD